MRVLKFFIFFSVCIVAMASFSKAEDFSASFDTYMTKTNSALKAGSANITSIKMLIKNYCSSVLAQQGFADNTFAYSAQQSVFVFLLCHNVAGTSSDIAGFSSVNDGGFFKLLTFRELGIVDRDILNLYNSGRVMPDYCDPTRDMDQCNLSKYISKLFTTIINEYVNLKQPSLYGVTVADKTDADLELQANDFSSEYFSGLQICDDSTQRLYPQTCRIMKGYIKHAGDLLADVRVFDVPTVLDTDITIGTCTATDPAFNLFLCGLYGDKSNSLQRFLNLSYNELFYYRLFISYYTLMLKSNASTILNIPQTSVNNELFTRITTFNNEFTWDQEAFSLTLRMMRDLYAAFPLHIGFLMYQEDLEGVGQQLTKIVTPLYTLSSKLKNVQQP